MRGRRRRGFSSGPSWSLRCRRTPRTWLQQSPEPRKAHCLVTEEKTTAQEALDLCLERNQGSCCAADARERERERGAQSRADVCRGLDLLGVAMLESIEAPPVTSVTLPTLSETQRRRDPQLPLPPQLSGHQGRGAPRRRAAGAREDAGEGRRGRSPRPRPPPPPPLLRFLLSLFFALSPKRAFAQRTCLFSQPEPRNQIVKLFDAITSRLQLLEEAETSFNVRSKLVPAKY